MNDEKSDRQSGEFPLFAYSDLFSGNGFEPGSGYRVGDRVSRDELFIRLTRYAPFPEKLKELMAPPEQLYVHGDIEWPSWSSDARYNIIDATSALLLRRDLPPVLSDYGVGIMSRGSNLFCAVIDSRRKIAAAGTIFNMFAQNYQWNAVEQSLKNALGRAERNVRDGLDFCYATSVV